MFSLALRALIFPDKFQSGWSSGGLLWISAGQRQRQRRAFWIIKQSHYISLFFLPKRWIYFIFCFLSSHRGENQTSTLVAPSVWRCNLD